MDQPVILIRPRMDMVSAIFTYRKELLETGSSTEGTNRIQDYSDIRKWIQVGRNWEKGVSLPPLYSPMTQLVYFRSSDRKIIGMLTIKHTLNNPRLATFVGNIAYSICPSERKKGYGVSMLKAALPYCRELGMKSVMVSCYSYNAGSRKIILANGGKFEKTVFDPEKNDYLERYWITL
jgi:predicted acetyltransferase